MFLIAFSFPIFRFANHGQQAQRGEGKHAAEAIPIWQQRTN